MDPVVELRPSTRRRRTVSAYRDGDRIVVLVPARMSRREQEAWAERMVARLAARDGTRVRGDDDLERRARELVARHLPELTLADLPTFSVRWSARQRQRWGSCTPMDGTIRISERLRGVPDWVLDDVLLHELAHLVEANHSPRFHELIARSARHAQAATWLEGYAAGLARSGAPQSGAPQSGALGLPGAGGRTRPR